MLWAYVQLRSAPTWARVLAVTLACMLGIAGTLAAQPGTATIHGTVTDARTGTPLAGVTVYIPDSPHGVLTNEAGEFRISGVPAGEHQLVVSKLGMREQRTTIRVDAGDSLALEFALAEQALLLPDVVVSTTREAQRLNETAASVGVISEDMLRETRPRHPADVMGQIPGVWVGVAGGSGEGHMTGIRQPKSTNPVYLFLENGVPTRSTGFFNHNALYEVNVPQAERIEVLKGPATALYGSDAIGGVVNVESGRPTFDPTAEAYVEGGGAGHARLLFTASTVSGRNGWRADLNFTRADGWRDATAYDRQSATLRWDRDLGNAGSLRTMFTVTRIDGANPSSLLEDDYRARPSVNYTPIAFRNVRAARFSSAYEKQTDRMLVSVTPYLRWNEMDLLPNWSLTYDPTFYTTGHRSIGVIARTRFDVAPIRGRIITGVDVDYSPGSRLEYRIETQRDGQMFQSYVKSDLLYDYDVTFSGVSPYVQVETDPTDRLHVSAGLRYDHMAYDYDSHLEPLQTGNWRRPADTRVVHRHVSPKLGVTYEFGPALNVYANYTHGFRVPSEGQIFRQGAAENTVDLKPVTADSREIGVRGEILGRVGYTLGAYRMVVSNDILSYVREDGIRESQNAGETLHQGIEAGVGVAVSDEVRLDASLAIARHEYNHWRPRPDVDYGGNEMESAPRSLANVRLAYSPAWFDGSRWVVEWNQVGPYWMDPENVKRYDGHALWHLQAAVPVTTGIELNVRLVNALNERYAETASYTAFRGAEYTPGTPRTLYVGAQYRWTRGGS